ncbi:hypothetical protein N802_00685 [Knoellia sinensis KCTC 19936]|uniref:DUF4870 domain-containing protein n=1 Tax=Knoellia sinensis KCTC 19936 TaxID=1385520 RepID=A0A0A0JB57_9MICO|nr:DUF4870 domain-containing protein [Knoellia sinensis]KGN34640.1 hypothetical protein N802_00685 [Knoellia sinensis KCTC 19936]
MTTTPQPEFEGQNPQAPQAQPQQGQTPPPPPYQPPAAGQPYSGQSYQGQTSPGQPTAYGQQVLDPAQQRQWGMFAHLIPLIAMVLSAGLLGFVGSLIIYVMYKERGDFVRQHAANSLNIQIVTGIVLLISFPLMLVLVGFVTYFLALAFAFVLHIIGALRANEGQQWTPPMTPAFVK